MTTKKPRNPVCIEHIHRTEKTQETFENLTSEETDENEPLLPKQTVQSAIPPIKQYTPLPPIEDSKCGCIIL